MPDTSPTPDALDRATDAVPAAIFHGAGGQAVRPCTPASVTRRHVRMLDVRPGMNVLEIGTGSGYSAALLAHLVGSSGSVTTVEIDTRLARRAKQLYAAHAFPVDVVVGDGLVGRPGDGPYDRMFVGTTPPDVPGAWLRQLAPDGVLITGVRVGDLPGAYAVARITVDAHRRPAHVGIHHGGYTPMSAPGATAPLTQATGSGKPPCAIALLGARSGASAAALLAALDGKPHVEPTTAPGGSWLPRPRAFSKPPSPTVPASVSAPSTTADRMPHSSPTDS
ncbi:protein-L-isoaspartate O-methyltransferase family protein [Streptomyces sp. MAR4 CNX-425]|uniref:protein-L-isoaspartate O-methyltransferase family protein n=1 Tax=Streptomyces sp. MAR4 CNX-425 TaxID=3406343 RepID=UPI003B510820